MMMRPAPETREEALDRSVEFFGLIAGSQYDPVEFRELAEAGMARSWRPEGTARQLAAIVASGESSVAP